MKSNYLTFINVLDYMNPNIFEGDLISSKSIPVSKLRDLDDNCLITESVYRVDTETGYVIGMLKYRDKEKIILYFANGKEPEMVIPVERIKFIYQCTELRRNL